MTIIDCKYSYSGKAYANKDGSCSCRGYYPNLTEEQGDIVEKLEKLRLKWTVENASSVDCCADISDFIEENFDLSPEPKEVGVQSSK